VDDAAPPDGEGVTMTTQRYAGFLRTEFPPEVVRLAWVDVLAIEDLTVKVTVSGVRVPDDSSSHPWTPETSGRVRDDVLARVEEIERSPTGSTSRRSSAGQWWSRRNRSHSANCH
jgi:hypothetical protein